MLKHGVFSGKKFAKARRNLWNNYRKPCPEDVQPPFIYTISSWELEKYDTRKEIMEKNLMSCNTDNIPIIQLLKKVITNIDTKIRGIPQAPLPEEDINNILDGTFKTDEGDIQMLALIMNEIHAVFKFESGEDERLKSLREVFNNMIKGTGYMVGGAKKRRYILKYQ